VHLIPAPATLTALPESFALTPATAISAPPGHAATQLAGLLRRPVTSAGAITLTLDGPAELGREGYLLDVDGTGVRLRAHTDEGLFRGVQTLRQLLPADVEGPSPQTTPWIVPGVRIEDRPRFAWRGVMLDVARHFFPVEDVKRFIDLAVPYKINILHLHLSDDQGWRLAVGGWPRLTTYGGGSEVGGGPGGFYTQDDYTEIVRYAAERHLTVVPEIDAPGHTNAALASYPELTRDGVAPERYTGIEVGFSSLAADLDVTYRFLDEVIGEIAALTPGPYLHIGGDEAHSTEPAEYARFITYLEQTVRRHGKTMLGWQEVAAAPLTPGDIVQYWRVLSGHEPDIRPARDALAHGANQIMYPAMHTYLDLKYSGESALGQDWAGLLEARQSYEWDPAALIEGVGETDVLGVEAALWTETLATWEDLTYMTLPRLPGIAEIGWSPAGGTWSGYAPRIAAHQTRWAAAGLRYHHSPDLNEA
jgi:hexosaminidase